MDYAADAICQFARVLHVRDIICAYASVLSFRRLIGLEARLSAIPGRVQGALHPAASAALAGPRGSASRGAAVGGFPPSSLVTPQETQATKALPHPRARMCTDRARATRTYQSARSASSACNARYRRKYNYITYGHSIYLMITVPIDTMLIINDLQIINGQNMGQIIQIGG